MSEPLWIVGGQQRGVPHWTREWKLYEQALVVKFANGQLTRVLEYRTPPEHCAPESPAILFKAASVHGNRAYLCTQTEVLICAFPAFSIERVISLPCFNDVHHVAVAPDGRLFVAVTGLDSIAELTPDGMLLRLVSVVDSSTWERFSPTTDYRRVATTKPHRSHPNFVFFLDGEAWVTRFEQRDAVPLDREVNGKKAISLGLEGVHDGHVGGDHVYFTGVNGLITQVRLTSGETQQFDLNNIRNSWPDRPLGWCRGILPVGEGRFWVGFSRIRYTALRNNIDWIRRGFQHADRHPPAPTRIACYDLPNQAVVDEVDLEPASMNAVFSIHGG